MFIFYVGLDALKEYKMLDKEVWKKHAFQNKLHSILLLSSLAVLLGTSGWLILGGLGLLLIIWLGFILMLAINPRTNIAAVMKAYRATPMNSDLAPTLHKIVVELSRRAGLSNPPTLFYIPSETVNAFTIGSQEQAAIGLTDGLLRNLNTREMAGVIAHEVSHIMNNDVWVMSMSDLMARLTNSLSIFGQVLLLLNIALNFLTDFSISWYGILILIFAPTISALIQLGLSRIREYYADLNAIHLTGDPEGLAQALQKIERLQGNFFERIFLPGYKVPEPSLLRTHPTTEERVERIRSMKETPRYQPIHLILNPPNVFVVEEDFMSRSLNRPRWHFRNGLWF